MDLQNLANEYAKNRISMIIEKTIKDIFSDGFKAGYQAKSDEIDEVEILKIAEAKAEVARAEAEKEAAERAETLRIAKEKAERERIEKERQEEQRIAAEKVAKEKADKEAKEAAAKKKAKNDRKDEQLIDMTFVDLDLPSGILWPKSITGEALSYREAIKKYHLPTFEQWNELSKECKIEYVNSSFRIRSANGEVIIFSCDFKKESNSSTRTDVNSEILHFWLDDEEDSNHEVRCVEIKITKTKYYDRDGYEKSTSEYLSHNVIRVFAGDVLPVIPVKSKV